MTLDDQAIGPRRQSPAQHTISTYHQERTEATSYVHAVQGCLELTLSRLKHAADIKEAYQAGREYVAFAHEPVANVQVAEQLVFPQKAVRPESPV